MTVVGLPARKSCLAMFDIETVKSDKFENIIMMYE
jgi:hypothetical protein